MATLFPVLDAHIHLFDPARPGGIPWPAPTDAILYQPALPARFAALAASHGVCAAIAIEASPRLEDNDWLLRVAEENPMIVGIVGNLDLRAPDFLRQLNRLAAYPLLLGLRTGNLWQRDLASDIAKPGVFAHLKAVAALGLALDTANPDIELLEAVDAIADRIPELRIVIDHLPAAVELESASARDLWRRRLASLGQNPNVYAKLSEVPRRIHHHVPRDPGFYRPTLDILCSVFDEDHVLFGSDWPNSDQWLPYSETFAIVREYFATKGAEAREKFFWQNSRRVYRWRMPEQMSTPAPLPTVAPS